MREWYGLTFGDPRNYDLCIDASRLRRIAPSAALIVRARVRRAASPRVMTALPKRGGVAFSTALRYRDFRLLWLGLLISNLGTWMQFTAMGFFVARMAGSQHQAALDLGILGAARAIPVLVLSPLAGVVADELPRRARALRNERRRWRSRPCCSRCSRRVHRLEMVGLVLISALNSARKRIRLADASELGADARRSRVRR